jgi:hypothetical protein
MCQRGVRDQRNVFANSGDIAAVSKSMVPVLPDVLGNLVNEYAALAVGTIIIFALGLVFWKLRRIERRLSTLRGRVHTLRGEVDALNSFVDRQFLGGLRSSGSSDAIEKTDKIPQAEASIVPGLTDIEPESANSRASRSKYDRPALRGRRRRHSKRDMGGEEDRTMIFFD